MGQHIIFDYFLDIIGFLFLEGYINPACEFWTGMSQAFGDRFRVDLVLGEDRGIGIPEFSPG